MILCLIFVAALGECSPAAHGSTEVRDASFGVRERCWNARGHLPATHFCSSGAPSTLEEAETVTGRARAGHCLGSSLVVPCRAGMERCLSRSLWSQVLVLTAAGSEPLGKPLASLVWEETAGLRGSLEALVT